MRITSIRRARWTLCVTALLAAPGYAQSQEPPAAESAPTEDSQRSADPCESDVELQAWIDRLQSSLHRITCSSAWWFDGLFGNRRYDTEYRSTHGTVYAGGAWSQREQFDSVARFKARFYLPQINERFNAFIGRGEADDIVTESTPELYTLPTQFSRRDDDSVFLGLGYNERMTRRGSFDADAGVRVRFPLDPYVKGSYRFARPVGENTLFRFRETIFWQKSEEFGTTALVEWDRILAPEYVLRWTTSGTYSEVSEGVRWFSNVRLYHLLSKERAFAYEAATNGSTDAPAPLTNYGVAAIYRQRIWRDWLVLELRTGIDWPRYSPYEKRTSNLNGSMVVEMRYGE
jgi:hypothetical protein